MTVTSNSSAFFDSPFIQAFSKDSNDSLLGESVIKYHYTSPDALLSIIQKKKIRFSDVNYMNDKSEGVFFVKLLLEFIEENHSNYPHAQEAINMLLNENNYEDIKSLQVSSIKYKEFDGFNNMKQRSFLLCLSSGPNLLNMWNYYIRNSSYEGYSIGLNMTNLLRAFDTGKEKCGDPFVVYYGNVLYEKEVQKREIEHLVEQIEAYARIASNKRLEFAAILLRQYITTRGYFFKHKSFAAEEEFRIVVSIADERIKNNKSSWLSNMKSMEQSFFVRKGLIVPGFSISLPEDAISRIYVSPVAENEIAKKGVRELIDSVGLKNIQVRKSNIPIRF